MSSSTSSQPLPSSFEAEHVHVVYDHIAKDFSRTRHTRWPFVSHFLESLPAVSSVSFETRFPLLAHLDQTRSRARSYLTLVAATANISAVAQSCPASSQVEREELGPKLLPPLLPPPQRRPRARAKSHRLLHLLQLLRLWTPTLSYQRRESSPSASTCRSACWGLRQAKATRPFEATAST